MRKHLVIIDLIKIKQKPTTTNLETCGELKNYYYTILYSVV